MRHVGKITAWKDDRGYGFITPNRGGEPVFVHIKAFRNRQRRPLGNEIVTYELGTDERGRQRATYVEFPEELSSQQLRLDFGWLAIPALFLAFVGTMIFLGRLPLSILGYYGVASVITYFAYAADIRKARNDQWRTPESSLHMLELIGGWPGAAVAQQVLRHKSQKGAFQTAFLIMTGLNCLGLVWLLTPPGAGALRSVFSNLR